MNLKEKTIEENVLYEGKILRLKVDDVRLPNGKISQREVIEHNGGVAILTITDEDEIVFVRQYRYPYKQEIIEIPAGKLEKDENPLQAGIRELKEETGLIAKKFYDLGQIYPSPGYTDEIIYLYAAKKLEQGEKKLDDNEFLCDFKLSFSTVKEKIFSDEIKDAKTVAAILKYDLIVNSGELENYRVEVNE